MALVHEVLPYVQLLAQAGLVIAAGIATYQFLLHRRERSEQNALEVLTRLTSTEFRTAYARVWELPLDATVEDVRAQGPDMEDAINCVLMTFEVMGVMVHNRMVPLDDVDQIIGGFLRESWRRLESYIYWRRERLGTRRWGEWYQWLAERLAVENRRGTGAYVAFKQWKP